MITTREVMEALHWRLVARPPDTAWTATWRVADITEPIAQADREVYRVTVTFEIPR